MAINQRDIKLLWGKAASRCAFPECRCELTQDNEATQSSFTIGEQAHIVAKDKNGPRGDSLLTSDERDSYDNLILLCPNHHTTIDKNPKDYPIEKLHSIKTNHELWVQQTLSQTWDLNQQARDLIYTSLIDSAVKYCHLSEWKKWTFGPLDSIPSCSDNLIQDFFIFRQKVFSTDFPGTLIELEKAIKTLSILLHKTARVFQKDCRLQKDCNGNLYYDCYQFYDKASRRDYDVWLEHCDQLVVDATKAANWFREIVRRDINPMFFAEDGKLVATRPWSADGGLSHQYLIPEYSQEEKDTLPDSLQEDE